MKEKINHFNNRRWKDPKEPTPEKQVMECISCKMSKRLIKELQEMVADGYHVSRSSFVRSAIRFYIKELLKYDEVIK
nr:MAG: DNA-binding protein, RHH family [uncultured archaeon]